jgi:hypothetical protein
MPSRMLRRSTSPAAEAENAVIPEAAGSFFRAGLLRCLQIAATWPISWRISGVRGAGDIAPPP